MGESTQHALLVSEIVTWIRCRHSDNRGLSVLVDSNAVPPERRPGQVFGFIPDVLARTVPSSFVIVGEAKSFSDFFLPHTTKQLTAFLEYLRLQTDPTMIVATPLGAAA